MTAGLVATLFNILSWWQRNVQPTAHLSSEEEADRVPKRSRKCAEDVPKSSQGWCKA